jgi:restriction system protein
MLMMVSKTQNSTNRKKRPSNFSPTFDQMIVPTVEALVALGGSGTTSEIYDQVVKIMNLPAAVIEVSHSDTGQTEVEYRLAWSRTYLRKAGLLINSARGVWALKDANLDPKSIDPDQIVKQVREQRKLTKSTELIAEDDAETDDSSDDWTEAMHQELLALSPAAFERLAQRLLRESGFINVEVTGKSGDGGIDGIGIARFNGFLSFQVMFQCKRYDQRSVPSSEIRDFRGAMQGRTDKGLFITTGTFTADAKKEATRDGAPPIDLIDGAELIQRLKELQLGVMIEMVEKVSVDQEWFRGI